MNFILIDTNCLVDMLVQEAKEENLLLLEYWSEHQKITLLVPPRLQEEWTRNENRVFNELRENINKNIGAFNKRLQKNLKAELIRLQNKAKRIQSLLEKGASCRANRNVHAEVGKRKDAELPPFHINKLSDGDAYIYFSGIEWLKKRKIKELVFLSHDKKAFSNPDNEKELHPLLKIPGINIMYGYGIGPGTNLLKGMLGGIYDEIGEESVDHKSIFFLFENKRNYSVAEQLHLAMDAFYDQLPMIPTHFLAKVFPFKTLKGQKNYTYFSGFDINTNNRSLVEFLRAVKINKNGTISFQAPALARQLTNAKKCIVTALDRLNNNLVYNISLVGDNLEANINLSHSQPAGLEQLYSNFDFLGAFTLLQKKPQKSAHDSLRHAYYNFQFGDFDAAMLLFDRVYEKCGAEGKPLLQFISLYNMKRLSTFIDAYYTSGDKSTHAILKKIKKIPVRDHFQTFETSSSPFIQECITWIGETDFYHEAYINLSETVDKIQDHYHLQLTGGSSSNSNYINLVSRFAEIDQFLELNAIIFNHYSNFEQVTEKLAEGLLMMYAFSKHQPVYLNEIDEKLLGRIIMFGRREILVKYFHRLNIESIRIAQGKKGSFTRKAEKFFADHKDLQLKLAKMEDQPVYFFWEKYYKVAANLLLFLTISDSKDDVSAILQSLVNIFKGEKSSRSFELEHIIDLISVKGQYMKTSVLNEFLSLALDTAALHNYVLFIAFSRQKRLHHKDLCLSSEKELEKIEQNFFQKCPKCNGVHEPTLLRELSTLLSEPLRKRLLSGVIDNLSKEFDPQLYYAFSIHGDIDYNLFFQQFMFTCPPIKIAPRRSPYFWSASEASYYRFNELMNIVFSKGISTTTPEFEPYKGMSNYYDWLLDMDGFDYNNFDPEWIMAYKTKFYYKQIFSTPAVITYMTEYLKKTKHPFLSQLMIKYAFGKKS